MNASLLRPTKPAHCAGFSLIEILLVLLIVGFIVGIASLAIDNRSSFNRRLALKEFGNHLNMVLAEAALSGKTWGVRIERSADDSNIIQYRWLQLTSDAEQQDAEQKQADEDIENNNNADDDTASPALQWRYATPYELEDRYTLPDETLVSLLIDNNPVDIANEVIQDDKAAKDREENPLLPQIVLQADGEVTPFTLSLSPAESSNADDTAGLELRVDSLGRLTLPGSEDGAE